jgi:hypothetical protein
MVTAPPPTASAPSSSTTASVTFGMISTRVKNRDDSPTLRIVVPYSRRAASS